MHILLCLHGAQGEQLVRASADARGALSHLAQLRGAFLELQAEADGLRLRPLHRCAVDGISNRHCASLLWEALPEDVLTRGL